MDRCLLHGPNASDGRRGGGKGNRHGQCLASSKGKGNGPQSEQTKQCLADGARSGRVTRMGLHSLSSSLIVGVACWGEGKRRCTHNHLTHNTVNASFGRRTGPAAATRASRRGNHSRAPHWRGSATRGQTVVCSHLPVPSRP